MFPDDTDALGRFEFLATLIAIGNEPAVRAGDTNSLIAHIASRRSHLLVLADCLGLYAGLSSALFSARLDAFIGATAEHDSHFKPENLNLLLSLQCGNPMPPFQFLQSGQLDKQMVFLPAWQSTFHLVHAALRGRARRRMSGATLATPPGFSTLRHCLTDVLLDFTGVELAADQAALDFIFFTKDATMEAQSACALVAKEVRAALGA